MANRAERMIRFLTEEILRNDDVELTETTPLVSSGLVDSFALVDVLLELEEVTGRKIPTGRVEPDDMDTVADMLDLADRHGTQP